MRKGLFATVLVAGVLLTSCDVQQDEGQQTAAQTTTQPETTLPVTSALTLETTVQETTAQSRASIACSNFTVRMQAQGYHDEIASPAEQKVLDPDGDGVACEGLTETPQ